MLYTAKWYRDFCARRLPPRGFFAVGGASFGPAPRLSNIALNDRIRSAPRPSAGTPRRTMSRAAIPWRCRLRTAFAERFHHLGLAEGNRHGFPPEHLEKKAMRRRPGIARERACNLSRLVGSKQGRVQRAPAGETIQGLRHLGRGLPGALGTSGGPLWNLQEEEAPALRRPLSRHRQGARPALPQMQSRPRPLR